VLATAVAACSSGHSPRTTPTTQAAPAAEYVAMGSSYAAGPGIADQLVGSCARSDHNYPHLVAAALHLTLDDVSCSGAVTANAINTDQGSQPPQVDAVTASTRLVTMTIGGNDVGYIATAIGCGDDTNSCVSSVNQTQLNAEFQALPQSLTTLIDQARTKAPAATIVLVTYPRLVPSTSCAALNYTSAATQLVASIGQRLEDVFVQVANQTHVRLVDPYVLGANHGPCAAKDARWVAGLRAPNGFPYHPTAAGHTEMAALVEAGEGAS
jgi:lysophospholipase L1-like esterase